MSRSIKRVAKKILGEYKGMSYLLTETGGGIRSSRKQIKMSSI